MADANPVAQTSVALLTGSIAMDSHLTKATTRAAINTSPEPVTNSLASVTEDVSVIGALYLIINHPVIITILVILFIIFSIWFLKKMFHLVKKIFARNKAPVMILTFLIFNSLAVAVNAETKKIIFVNSYHEGYTWSDGVEYGFDKVFEGLEQYEITKIRMNTKVHKSIDAKESKALYVKNKIDSLQPDLVVVSDDNAVRYVLAEYYKDAAIPFVFCGVNWDASIYGLPYSNTTGMIEQSPVIETIELMRKYARGDKLGFLASNTMSARKMHNFYVFKMNIDFAAVSLVDNIVEWEREYIRLQDSVDMLLLATPVGVTAWDEDKGQEIIDNKTKIITGATSDSDVHYAIVGKVKIAEEQGRWAAKTAIEILNGKDPREIPLARNKESKLYINKTMAKKIGIKFDSQILKTAEKIGSFK